MSVYVDPLHELCNDLETTPKCFRNKPSCHLYADTLEELHILASKIGLKRSWFQPHRLVNHYDLVPSKRKLAIVAGAIEHTRHEAVEKWKEIRIIK